MAWYQFICAAADGGSPRQAFINCYYSVSFSGQIPSCFTSAISYQIPYAGESSCLDLPSGAFACAIDGQANQKPTNIATSCFQPNNQNNVDGFTSCLDLKLVISPVSSLCGSAYSSPSSNSGHSENGTDEVAFLEAVDSFNAGFVAGLLGVSPFCFGMFAVLVVVFLLTQAFKQKGW